jgi:CIC family chloride channel protein
MGRRADAPARAVRRARNWVRRAGYWRRWLALGVTIGLVAGLCAIAFSEALALATHVLTGMLGGYQAPAPAGDGGGQGTGHFRHAWAIPAIVGLGGLAAGMLNAWLAPPAPSRGIDACVEAAHTDPRKSRGRSTMAEFAASAITIGSGGSAGRGGPTAQLSAGFGSLLARALDLSAEDGKIAVCVGIGSGFGAIIGAPVGGAALAGEVIYRNDFEGRALFPGFIASATSYVIFGSVEGFTPLFGYAGADYRLEQPMELAWFAVLGVLAGLIGLIYSTTFHGVVAAVGRIPANRAVKPAIGGLLVGLLALGIPQVMGTGNGWIQDALDRPQLLRMPLWIILTVPLAKIAATALSVGTGGGGDLAGPGLVTGAFMGAAVWRVLEPVATDIPHNPAPFVIVGMMACLGSIARTPVAMMFMVAEMTGSTLILAPAIVTVGIAYFIVGCTGQTIYRSQVRTRR